MEILLRLLTVVVYIGKYANNCFFTYVDFKVCVFWDGQAKV